MLFNSQSLCEKPDAGISVCNPNTFTVRRETERGDRERHRQRERDREREREVQITYAYKTDFTL